MYREVSGGIDPVYPYRKSYFLLFLPTFFLPRDARMEELDLRPAIIETLWPAAYSGVALAHRLLRRRSGPPHAPAMLRLLAARMWRRQAACSGIDWFTGSHKNHSKTPNMRYGCSNIRELVKKITGSAILQELFGAFFKVVIQI